MMSTVVIDKNSLLDIIHQHKSEITSFGVRSLGLFGSFVRNTANENSDIDLLVDFEPQKKTFDNFMDLAFFLEQLFGRKTELVTPQSLNKYIGPHILKEVEHVII
jgi:predicted nucleotidyltransferase